MLSFLKISNLAILEEVAIEPGPGLNVLTGETGAGKSIIVDAIGLLLGERGGAELIRTGCDRMVVEAQFDVPRSPEVDQALRAAGIEPAAGGELVIRREVLAQQGAARGRAVVSGQLTTLSALKEIGGALADLHGQHQHQSLLGAAGQRDALDGSCGAFELREEVRALHRATRALRTEHEQLTTRESERARREETLRREVAEIDAANPILGEDEELARDETLLRHAVEVSRLAGQAFSHLSEDDDSVMTRLGSATDDVTKLASFDPQAASILAALAEARVVVSEAARELGRYLDAGEFDPGRLDQVGARLAALDRLRRKYGATLADVLEYRTNAAAELLSLGGVAARLAEISDALERAHQDYLNRAGELTAMRRKGALKLEKAVAAELKTLAMEGTRVAISVMPLADGGQGPLGIDQIEFLIAPNKGEELRPLARIASGGELSRLMLAVRNAAEGREDGRTLVFDEVDSGIGGTVAEAVGRRLARLARRQQILCVTHLPQIASFADRHFSVVKRTDGSRTRAEVSLLDEPGRVAELARMLGSSEEKTARQHAAALVDRAHRAGKGAR